MASPDHEPPSPAQLQGLSVSALIDRRALQRPSAIALSARAAAGHRERLSYAQLARWQRRVGEGLARLGVARGDRVAVYLDNDAGREAVLTALGCWAIGAVVVPLSTRGSDGQLAQALALVRPRLVVGLAASAPRLAAASELPLALLDGPQPAWPATLDGPAPGPAEAAGPSVSPTEPACLLFTSGTTAQAKAVVHTHRSLLHAGLAMGAAVGLVAGDLYQGAFPFFTSSCLNLGCMSSWVHGAGFVMEHHLDSAQRLALADAEGTTVYHGVPSVIQLMLAEAERGAEGLRRVRRLAYGGAAMPAPLIGRAAVRWPWMEQVHVWGMTESGPAGAYLPPHWLPAKAGLMGQAMPHCELRVVDGAGRPVGPGTPGELLFRGPSLAAGYFEDPEATALAFRDGWLHTGDLVVADGDGLLRFIDRVKDVINRGGLKVSSAAVEAALLRFPGIADVAVVAVPDERLGEEVAACVVPAPGHTLDTQTLGEWCRAHLARHEVPRRWAVMPALPRNPMGKVLKRELRQALADGGG
ncbi:MAG: acyl--CoA ligase [Comamonadaceae bacterium]|jgi:acyl-CoA synthetase (AMP-forming)/AMP-acid ligase II|uniref:Long-chain fatty acid--CoA ligase n=1 Tax=Hydrogenophaga borbori TaxID=2294117 RepID=A0A372EP62_9BURK|nr:class I adenylate-forming enzyme family protein [Hydrogenophaga borbori]NCT99703.1 acyl--CoA ligase [Comamonadaceae bacterium]RFP82419.1 hypothetical protein DY262_00870 [Hydrogenophaga borbori]